MGDVSDIESLLRAHQLTRRWAWMKPLAAALCTVVGTALGAGWAARGYLAQLATKDDVAKLMAGHDQALRDIQTINQHQDDRLTKTEVTAMQALDIANNSGRRVDGILAGSLWPIARQR